MNTFRTALCFLSVIAQAQAYSFLSCANYDAAQNVCYGYLRDYAAVLPVMDHAYNFQKNAYGFSDATRVADNQASQADVAVDPTLQNRTSAYSADPNDQQVYNAYEGYPMLTAFPGQNITLTWPRTADPDGTVPDGSSAVNIYYSPNSSSNAGANFSAYSDPSLAVFQQNYVATLPFDDYNACLVNDNKYDLAVHCNGQIQIPPSLTDGIYTFLWHWVINNTSPTPVDGVTLYLDYRFAFEVNVNTTLVQ
ncbi:hypothetical protein WJX82_005649 [Trebouxia sp. C0006]